MALHHLLLFFIAVALVLCPVQAITYTFCEAGVDGPNIPTIPDDNLIDVYYLEAPVFEGFFGPVFGLINGYHTAVGFYDR